MNFNKWIFLTTISCLILSCTEDVTSTADIQESAQQIGDLMASVDEAGGTSDGTIALLEGQRRFIVRKDKELNPNHVQDLFALFIPIKKAEAVSCGDTTFSACSGSQKTRTLSGCKIGSATFTGSVDLTFSENDCLLNAVGETVDRSPNFSVTGRRSATLVVETDPPMGQGQRLTRSANPGEFTFSSDGIRRVFTANGETLFDFTTSTTAAIGVTGTSRSDRVMSGGSLRVMNNLSTVYCDYVPSAVTWSADCNCASSGAWTGSCSDGKSSSLEITSCGRGTISVGDASETVSFDRCFSTN